MEQELQIPTNDNHLIHGTLTTNNSQTLIIFVHGLTGHRNEHIPFNAAKFFVKNNIDFFRFDLYTFMDKGRSILETDILTHAQDINTVVSHLRKNYQHIYLMGHSLGGPSILYSQQEVEGLLLLEPSLEIYKYFQEEITLKEDQDEYILNWGVNYVLSKKYIKSLELCNLEQLKLFKKPTLIICGENGDLDARWKPHLNKIPVSYEYKEIANASHCFDEEGTEEKVLEESLKWIQNN